MSKGTVFLAHRSDVPLEIKKPLSQFSLKKLLSNNNNIFNLLNNVCPHQGSLILSNESKNIKCQYHGWGWDISGNPISSGNTKVCNSYKLNSQAVFEKNNLLFTSDIDLSAISNIDLSYMKLITERVDVVPCKFTNIVDVFLDVDHIPVVHTGVYNDIGIDESVNVSWNYYEWGSIQSVKKNSNYSPEFLDTLLKIPEEELAAFWITIYPGTMIEWQPGALFVTVCIPDSDYTNVCVFKYRDTRYCDKNWMINSNMWETAWKQDKHQASVIVNRCNYVPHLEESKIHYRNWLEK